MNDTTKDQPAGDSAAVNNNARTRVVGTLEPFFETGTEGVVWSLTMSGAPGYDALTCLKNEDDLLVYNPDGTALWAGRIHLEYKRNYHPYPLNPGHGQQAVNGLWVNGLQNTVNPETWSGWFHAGLPAVAWIAARKPSAGRVKGVWEMERDQRVLAQALDLVLAQPDVAWNLIETTAPNLAARMRANMTHGLTYRYERLHWSVPQVNLSASGIAGTWQTLVALSRAERALGGGQDPWDAMAARWPNGDEADLRDIIEVGRQEFLYDRFPVCPGPV